MRDATDELRVPEYLNDGDTVYIRKENLPDKVVWMPAKVVCAMGNHARVVTKLDGEIVDTWRSLDALRVLVKEAA